MERVQLNGPRSHPPSQLEVLSVLSHNPYHHSQPISIPVHLPNSSYQVSLSCPPSYHHQHHHHHHYLNFFVCYFYSSLWVKWQHSGLAKWLDVTCVMKCLDVTYVMTEWFISTRWRNLLITDNLISSICSNDASYECCAHTDGLLDVCACVHASVCFLISFLKESSVAWRFQGMRLFFVH